jgi:hypothetical protein
MAAAMAKLERYLNKTRAHWPDDRADEFASWAQQTIESRLRLLARRAILLDTDTGQEVL